MFDSGNWTLTMMNANISMVSTRFEVVVTEEPHLVTDAVLPIEVEVRLFPGYLKGPSSTFLF